MRGMRRTLAGTAVALVAATGAARAQVTIAVDAARTYQTMSGWEVTAQAGQDSPSFPLYKDALFDQAIDDLGINRVRLEIRSGVEDKVDWWAEWRAGLIDKAAWESHRYADVNDNGDPFSIDWAGFQFSQFDRTVDDVVMPLKRRIEARGEKLFVNVNYVSFIRKLPAGLDYCHDDSPEEYAEFVLATVLHLQKKYGWAPDAWEVILEPDNTSFWRGTQIGEAIAASARRLKEHGFSLRFIGPSTTDLSRAPAYFDDMIKVPGVLPVLSELSYHRYGGVSPAGLRAIGGRASQYGIGASMLEHIGSGYPDLHNDLKTGRNTSWQQYTLAFPAKEDSGGHCYRIDDADPSAPRIVMGERTKFLRQYFKFVRAGAVRIGATSNNASFDPVAFVNADGRQVVVVKAAEGGAFAVSGLPAGRYGIKYTTASQYDVDRPDVDVTAGGTLEVAIPEAGVVTVHAKNR